MLSAGFANHLTCMTVLPKPCHSLCHCLAAISSSPTSWIAHYSRALIDDMIDSVELA